MNVHYLIDTHANPIDGARVVDVMTPADGLTQTSGSFVVQVPSSVGIKDPENLSDLLLKKHEGLLAVYAGFPNIVYDDLMNIDDIDFTDSQVKGVFGQRGIVILEPGARLKSTVTAIGVTAPTQAIVLT
jgi:hypothetical protein